MLGFVSAHIPWNVISNPEMRRVFHSLKSDLALPCANTLANICRREYDLTVEHIKAQLPSKNKISIALDGWTSTNRLAITSVIGYYLDPSWKLQEVQLAFDEVSKPNTILWTMLITSQVKGSHSGERLADHLKDVLSRFDLDDGRLLAITTDNASSNYSMTRELQRMLQGSGIDWSAGRNHIPCMAHVIQLCLGAFMSSLGVKGREKSWEAHERDQQFQASGNRIPEQRKQQGNARVAKVVAMKPGLPKIIEKVSDNC